MLERATHLGKERGGGSLTALPIIETEAQNISAYIPTNLISITDGQIYLSPSLFELGVLPAVDVGKSVSRVGGKAQRAAYRAVAGDLKLAYAQFEELETFARFGARLDEGTRKIIEHGRRIRACLKQPESTPVSVPAQIAVLLALTTDLFDPVSVPAQIAILLALTADLFDPVPLDKMTDAGHAVHDAAAKIPEEVCARFQTADKLSDADRTAIIEIARQALAPFQPKPAAKSEPDKEVGDKPGPAAKTGGRAEPKPDKSTPVSASKPEQKAGPEPAEGTKADAATKPKLESEAGAKPDGGTPPKASATANADPTLKPEVKVKES
jgi:F-type H+-transporting ATPase subunit alpha